MAGYSVLEAVNQVLAVLDLEPESSLDSSGSWPSKTYGGSTKGQAERWLYHFSRQCQSQGYPSNTEQWSSTIGSPGTVTFPSNTLKQKPIGKNSYRRIVMRNNAAYDADNGTATFAAGTYDFEIVKEIDFSELDIDAQTEIIEKTRAYFEQTKRNNPNQQNIIRGELAEAKVKAQRPLPRPDTTVAQPRPVVLGMGGGSQQQ